MNAIDTNIFAYTFDPTDPTKQTLARKLLSRLVLKPQETILLWQVTVELLACLRKAEAKGVVTAEELKDPLPRSPATVRGQGPNCNAV